LEERTQFSSTTPKQTADPMVLPKIVVTPPKGGGLGCSESLSDEDLSFSESDKEDRKEAKTRGPAKRTNPKRAAKRRLKSDEIEEMQDDSATSSSADEKDMLKKKSKHVANNFFRDCFTPEKKAKKATGAAKKNVQSFPLLALMCPPLMATSIGLHPHRNTLAMTQVTKRTPHHQAKPRLKSSHYWPVDG